MKKKTTLTLIVLLLVLCLCFTLVACGEKDKDDTNTTGDNNQQSQDVGGNDDPTTPGEQEPEIGTCDVTIDYFIPLLDGWKEQRDEVILEFVRSYYSSWGEEEPTYSDEELWALYEELSDETKLSIEANWSYISTFLYDNSIIFDTLSDEEFAELIQCYSEDYTDDELKQLLDYYQQLADSKTFNIVEDKDFYIYVELNNKDNLKVESITINGVEYKADSFHRISDNHSIFVKLNVGKGSGAYKVEATKVICSADGKKMASEIAKDTAVFNCEFVDVLFERVLDLPHDGAEGEYVWNLYWNAIINSNCTFTSLSIYKNSSADLFDEKDLIGKYSTDERSFKDVEPNAYYTIRIDYVNAKGEAKVASYSERIDSNVGEAFYSLYENLVYYNIDWYMLEYVSDVSLFIYDIETSKYVFDKNLDYDKNSSQSTLDDFVYGASYMIQICYKYNGTDYVVSYCFVAQDDTPQPPTPIDTGIYIQPAEFFDALWTASSFIGQENFASDDSIGFSSDMNVKLTQNNYSIDLGISLNMVLDANGGNNSAIKINVYNNATNDDLFTLYHFSSDSKFIYLQIEGQKIAIPVDFLGEYTLGQSLDELFAIDKLNPTTTVADVIDQLKDGFGYDWTLDNLADVILNLEGMSLDEIIDMFVELDIVDEDTNSLLHILEELSPIFFNKLELNRRTGKWISGCKREEIDGGFHYTGDVDGTLGVNIWSNLLEDYFKISNILLNEITFEFDTTETAEGIISNINGLSLFVDARHAAYRKNFTLEISLNDITITNLGAVTKESATQFIDNDFDADDYSSTYNLSLECQMLNHAFLFCKCPIEECKLTVNAHIDLANENNTIIDATLASLTGEEIAKFNLSNSQFTFVVCNKTVMEFIAEGGFVYALQTLAENENFSDLALMIANAIYVDEIADLDALMLAESVNYDNNFCGLVIKDIDVKELFLSIASILAEYITAEPSPYLVPTIANLLGVMEIGHDDIRFVFDKIINVLMNVFDVNNINDIDAVLFGENGILDEKDVALINALFSESDWIDSDNPEQSIKNLLSYVATIESRQNDQNEDEDFVRIALYDTSRSGDPVFICGFMFTVQTDEPEYYVPTVPTTEETGIVKDGDNVWIFISLADMLSNVIE